MKYKCGDKVVIKINKLDAFDLSEGNFVTFGSSQLLGKLEDFTPAEKKIVMTVEEKKEFDKLEKTYKSLYWAFIDITKKRSSLYDRLFCNDDDGENNKAQLEFSRAWDKPSRIEVIKPEHEFKVGDLVKINGEKAIIIKIKKDVREPFKLILQDGSYGRANKNYIEFIKSNAISWNY